MDDRREPSATVEAGRGNDGSPPRQQQAICETVPKRGRPCCPPQTLPSGSFLDWERLAHPPFPEQNAPDSMHFRSDAPFSYCTAMWSFVSVLRFDIPLWSLPFLVPSHSPLDFHHPWCNSQNPTRPIVKESLQRTPNVLLSGPFSVVHRAPQDRLFSSPLGWFPQEANQRFKASSFIV
jgi:hypothetical protein